MAKVISLTENFARATATGDEQPLYTALDVSEFDALDLLITGGFESPVSPILTLTLLSGNQLVSTSGWVEVSVAPGFRGTPAAAVGCWTITRGFFRYVRWKAGSLAGASAANFRVEGIGRRSGG